MTSFDIFAVVHELSTLEDARLENIYQIEQKFLFTFRKMGQGKYVLLVEPEVRVHLTRFDIPKPKSPPNFCIALRKHIRGAKVRRVFQHNFDRIIGIEFERGGVSFQVILELFNRGSLIVVRENGTILMSQRYRKMRDRDILPGKPFQYPPLVGKDIFSINREDLDTLFQESKTDVVRTLARSLNIGGLYAEEIVQQAQIAKNHPANTLSDINIDELWKALNSIVSRLRAKPPELNPTIISDQDQIFDVVPFPLVKYSNSDQSFSLLEKPSMNEALDDFFMEHEKKTALVAEKEPEQQEHSKPEPETKSKDELRLEHQLKTQEKRLIELKENIGSSNFLGSLILSNLTVLEEITSTILQARKNGFEWDIIEKKIQEGRKNGIESAKKIQTLIPDRGLVVVEIDGTELELDFTQKVSAISQHYFKQSHKQRDKIEGTKGAIEKTQKQLERAREESTEIARKEEIKTSMPVELRKRDWFEKFRWFHSSDGFLTIAGRDAHSNEAIVKRYMKKEDVFVHATVHGAPHAVIQAEGKEIPESTIQEAAQFAASFSSAWKAGSGATDTYYVDPEQVSFTPQSGEYLVRGGVIIRGKRNQLKGTVLETAVGIIIEEKYARVIGGPPTAVKAQTEYFLTLKPGDETRGKISKQIRDILATKSPEQEKHKIILLDLNEFVRFIPGNSQILEIKNSKVRK